MHISINNVSLTSVVYDGGFVYIFGLVRGQHVRVRATSADQDLSTERVLGGKKMNGDSAVDIERGSNDVKNPHYVYRITMSMQYICDVG